MTISRIRNPWVRRPLVVLYGTIYVTLMILCAIILAVCEGACYMHQVFAEFMADWRGPLKGAWRGRRGR